MRRPLGRRLVSAGWEIPGQARDDGQSPGDGPESNQDDSTNTASGHHQKSAEGIRGQGTHLAALDSLAIRPGIPSLARLAMHPP